MKSTLFYVSNRTDCLGTESAERVKRATTQSALEHVLKDLIMAGHAKSLILHATTRGVTNMSMKTGSWQDPLDARSACAPYEPA